MNSKKDQKNVNLKRTNPSDIVPSHLLSKCREPILLKNTADSKDNKISESKVKELDNVPFNLWPDNIDKYIDSNNKEIYKEKNYDYIVNCIGKSVIWKRPQQFFKMIKNKKAEIKTKQQINDDMAFLLMNQRNNKITYRDDIELSTNRKSYESAEETFGYSICDVVDKKVLVNYNPLDAKDGKKSKKKQVEQEYTIIKEFVLSNLRLDDQNSDLINWVTSCIQFIIDQNLLDCEVN